MKIKQRRLQRNLGRAAVGPSASSVRAAAIAGQHFAAEQTFDSRGNYNPGVKPGVLIDPRPMIAYTPFSAPMQAQSKTPLLVIGAIALAVYLLS
jgi:hypothetical protein